MLILLLLLPVRVRVFTANHRRDVPGDVVARQVDTDILMEKEQTIQEYKETVQVRPAAFATPCLTASVPWCSHLHCTCPMLTCMCTSSPVVTTSESDPGAEDSQAGPAGAHQRLAHSNADSTCAAAGAEARPQFVVVLRVLCCLPLCAGGACVITLVQRRSQGSPCLVRVYGGGLCPCPRLISQCNRVSQPLRRVR